MKNRNVVAVPGPVDRVKPGRRAMIGMPACATGCLGLVALLLAGLVSARAIPVVETTPASEISPVASSSWDGAVVPRNLVDGAGMDGQDRHDNNSEAVTMWHTGANPGTGSPAPGLPAGAAWLRFNFKTPRELGKCIIWNHNQRNLTDRGFRHVRAFVTSDGQNWEKVSVNGEETFEIPRAHGSAKEPASFELPLPHKAISGLILLASDNYGGNVYGLSAVRFVSAAKDVPAASLPIPAVLTASDFPLVDDGKDGWQRQVTVKCGEAPIYEAVDATVQCDGATVSSHIEASPAGRERLVLNLPPGKANRRSSADKVQVTLKTTRWSRNLETQVVPFKQWPELEEVIFTWKTHLDIGYTHHPLEVMNRYRANMMDHALALMDGSSNLPPSQRFLWMLPAWAMDLVLDDKQTPERRARLEQAVRDHRLIWHGLPYTFEAEAMDSEEMVRCLEYGVRIANHFDVPAPTDAKLTDVPVQAWLTPTVLAHAGIKFLHIGSNGGSKPAKVPTLFWWEGPDGSRLLTGYSNEYGWPVMPPAGWTHKTWLAMIVTSDNSGPPSPAEVESALHQVRTQLPGVRARFGRPSDFADAILKEGSEIPVVHKDMPDTWIHGMMSLPMATGIHRKAGALLPTLGMLDTELGAWKVEHPGDVASCLLKGYEQSCFYTEHTWGPSIGRIPGGDVYDPVEFKKRLDQGMYVNYEAEFDFHANYARQGMAAVEQGMTPRIEALAKAVSCEGPRVVVFNPLPWIRESAEVSVTLPEGAPVPASVRDLRTNKILPATIEGRTMRFLGQALPPGGYVTFQCIAGPMSNDAPVSIGPDGMLDTVHFRVKFDLQRGGIRSLVEKATGRELVDGSQRVLGQFLHQRFDKNEVNSFVHAYCRFFSGWALSDFGKSSMPDAAASPHWDATPGPWKISVIRDAVGEKVTLTCEKTLGLAEGYTTTFVFPKTRPCVDIDWAVKDKTPNPLPEGGWLCVPVAIAPSTKPVFRVGAVGGSIDPASDIVVGGNRHLLAADRAITVRAEASGAGVGVASVDLPLWSLGEPGLWKYSDGYVPTKPELFVNLYNNQWNTNYLKWTAGSWKASIRIWPVANGASEEQAVFTPAWELRQGVLAEYAASGSGSLPTMRSGLSLSRKGVRVTAFCPNPYGSGTVVRVWEQAGISAPVEVTLPDGLGATRAQPVNLRGEKAGDEIAIKDGRFSFPLGAWSPVSFALH